MSPWTRRNPMREAVAAWKDVTGMLRGRSGKLSQLRVTALVLLIAFVKHWPDTWTWQSTVVLVALLAAIPLDALFARLPLADVLGAVQAVAGSVARRASARFADSDEPYSRDASEYDGV